MSWLTRHCIPCLHHLVNVHKKKKQFETVISVKHRIKNNVNKHKIVSMVKVLVVMTSKHQAWTNSSAEMYKTELHVLLVTTLVNNICLSLTAHQLHSWTACAMVLSCTFYYKNCITHQCLMIRL